MQTITSKDLLNNKDTSLLILDIREEQPFNDWHIKDSLNIPVYNDIWQGNFDRVKKMLGKLPKDKKIVTVCNAGVTSQNASMLLESMGYDTLILERGMMGWNSSHVSSDIMDNGKIILRQIIRVGKGCLSYLIGSRSTKECMIIDPSNFVNEYVEMVNSSGFKLKAVIETHVHADHVSGALRLAEYTKSDYHVSAKDLKAKVNFTNLTDGKMIQLGDSVLKVIETPGHTDGSVCIVLDDIAIFTGDTLFIEGVGRPDLGRSKEDAEKGASVLFESINKIKQLDKNLLILPAHFSSQQDFPISKKLGEIINMNKSMNMNSQKDFVDFITNNTPESPPNYIQIKNINMNCLRVQQQMAEQMEFGPNRCASG